MIENVKIRLLNSPEWAISICVFLVYWLVNKSYTGPAILWDEIGYLANAALISGHTIDGATSYHAGYSFFLAPLFVNFSEPSQIWQAAMVLNAFIWAVSFLLLARILRLLLPELSKKQLVMALIISAAYPAWITMSGYVFATTVFVFVYLLSILALLFWNPNKYWTIIPHCLLVGYLYWIHPIGLAVAVASFIVVGFVSIKAKKYVPALLNLLLIVALITIYNEGIDKWLVMLATPENYDPFFRHYPDSERIIGKLFNYDFWLHLIAKSFGQISYLIIASFGLILFGFISSINNSSSLFKRLNRENSTNSNIVRQSVFVFLILALLGILSMGIIFFSGSESRVDQWIYGRYSEMVALPLLALGCFSIWKKKWLFGAALFVFITGLLLNHIADMEALNHFIHTVAFWPQYVIWETNFLYWMGTGALVLVLVGRVWNDSKSGNILIAVLVMMCFVISAVVSSSYHHNIIAVYSKASSFVDIIRENYPAGTCVGYNPEGADLLSTIQRQRYHLKLFYLYDYDYRRMSTDEWLKNCNGPYFTYSLDELYEKKDVKLIGQEMFSKIYLVAKCNGHDIVMSDISKTVRDIYKANGWSINYKLKYENIQLAELSGQVGRYKNGRIYSTGEDGFLLVDSTTKLGPGKYNFVLRGDASIDKGSWADIVSSNGNIKHAKFEVNDNSESTNDVIAAGTFILEQSVLNLEIRVYVNAVDNMRIDGYEIEYII